MIKPFFNWIKVKIESECSFNSFSHFKVSKFHIFTLLLLPAVANLPSCNCLIQYNWVSLTWNDLSIFSIWSLIDSKFSWNSDLNSISNNSFDILFKKFKVFIVGSLSFKS